MVLISKNSSGRAYNNFINSIRSNQTKRTYLYTFKTYLQYVGIDTVEDSDALLLKNPKVIEAEIIDFLISLKDKKLSYSHVKSHLTAIIHFYTMNDILLNRKKIGKFLDDSGRRPNMTKKNQGYTIEQIRKILDICDERLKAVIILYASAGLRLAALTALKVGDLTEVSLDESVSEKLYRITVYEGYKEEYTAFCTPECKTAIDSYLSYRTRCGEIITPDSPLIREQFDMSDSFQVKHPKPIQLVTIQKNLRQKLIQAGVRKEEHAPDNNSEHEGAKVQFRKEVPLIHGFRKFFNTSLMNSDVHPSFKELLMGHSIKLDGVYYHKDSQKSRRKLLEEYCKAIDALTINEDNRLKIKVEELTARNESNEYVINRRLQEKELEAKSLQQKYEQDMKAVREEMNQQFGQIMSMIQQNPKLAHIKPGMLTKKIKG
ncbi:MAG: hypothetical protein WA667_03875 [Candidatus Nitrosopolaris sp.]